MLRILLVTLGLLLATDGSAGTLCGTVRDELSGAPVPGAAVFLLDDTGASTGQNTGTAADGSWCLDDVAPGTYSILVSRDDYRIARVDDIVVEDTTTDVAIGAQTAVLFAEIAPNPASNRVTLRWRVPERAEYTLEIFDARGRRVQGWSGTGTGDDRSHVWDLRSFDDRVLGAGTYFAALGAGGQRSVQKLVLLR